MHVGEVAHLRGAPGPLTWPAGGMLSGRITLQEAVKSRGGCIVMPMSLRS